MSADGWVVVLTLVTAAATAVAAGFLARHAGGSTGSVGKLRTETARDVECEENTVAIGQSSTGAPPPLAGGGASHD